MAQDKGVTGDIQEGCFGVLIKFFILIGSLGTGIYLLRA